MGDSHPTVGQSEHFMNAVSLLFVMPSFGDGSNRPGIYQSVDVVVHRLA